MGTAFIALFLICTFFLDPVTRQALLRIVGEFKTFYNSKIEIW